MELGMTPDEFIAECADNQSQKDFFNSLTEKEKDNVRTFMLAYRGYGNYLLLEFLESMLNSTFNIEDEIKRLMRKN